MGSLCGETAHEYRINMFAHVPATITAHFHQFAYCFHVHQKVRHKRTWPNLTAIGRNHEESRCITCTQGLIKRKKKNRKKKKRNPALLLKRLVVLKLYFSLVLFGLCFLKLLLLQVIPKIIVAGKHKEQFVCIPSVCLAGISQHAVHSLFLLPSVWRVFFAGCFL